jgi:hypothetical protein
MIPAQPLTTKEILNLSSRYARANFRAGWWLVWRYHVLPMIAIIVISWIMAMTYSGSPREISSGLGVIGLLFCCYGILSLFLTGGMTELVLATIEEREVRFEIGKSGPIFFQGFLLGLMTILTMIFRLLPGIGTIIQFVAEYVIVTQFWLTSIIVVGEDATGAASIPRAWYLTSNFRWLAVRRYFLSLIVAGIVGIPVFVLLILLYPLFPGEKNALALATIAEIIALFIIAFNYLWTTYFHVLHYEDLRTRHGEIEYVDETSGLDEEEAFLQVG